uniref:DH domain-containing protein n=1 Tax=Amphimedon queenslandica TaxID=400682 RepID=A0A1X7UAC7_AMPQE
SEELLRVYLPYINYFEVTKEALSSCDRQFPRFHAFLKCNESKPECGRQTLSELLITPVQRIPRIILLLQDLLKRTDTGHIDYKQLEESVEKLKNVMEHINEDKRKTEKQMHMFELIRDIEDVPATVLSSHHWFISRHDVLELNISNNGKTNKPLSIALFLFSDSIEVR